MKDKKDNELGSWKRAVTVADGTWQTRGWQTRGWHRENSDPCVLWMLVLDSKLDS